MRLRTNIKNKAFTLIELLLVVSIVGLLVSIVMVGLQSARRKAKVAKALQWSQNIHSVLGDSIEGAWSFNEGSGHTTVSDVSGNGNNGTLVNGVQFTADTPNRKLGYALKFNGGGAYVNCGNVGNVKTISFWLKPDNLTTNSILELNGTQTITISNSQIQANSFASPTIYVDAKQSLAIPDNNWHYILIVQSSNISASAVYLGKVGTNYFNGLLDEVRIYSVALQTAEIQKRYARGLNSLLKKGLITKKDYETRLITKF